MRATHLVQLLLWSGCWLMSSCAAGPVGDAAAGEWSLVRRDRDVEIYRQPVEDSDIPAVRGYTLFHAPVSEVFRVISDYDHFAGFIPLVSESRVLESDARSSRVYQRLGLPLLIADRHYIIRVENDLHAPAQGVIDVGWQLDKIRSLSLSSKGAVVPDAFSGSWHLEAVPGKADCDAIYTVHVEPGGALPNWLFVRVTERYVIQVMDAVRKRIAVNSK